MNIQRSVTAERLYRDDERLEVRSAGVRHGAKRRVCEADLEWADAVYVMEHDHKLWISMRFEGIALPPIDVLDIPDRFELMADELQRTLRTLLDPRIAHLCNKTPTKGHRP
ncbi:hypothetical protein [Oleiharenicola lentus]|nr:hypothetical protein [Oleiharenicola lentus]